MDNSNSEETKTSETKHQEETSFTINHSVLRTAILIQAIKERQKVLEAYLND
jgi:hypothetical protein